MRIKPIRIVLNGQTVYTPPTAKSRNAERDAKLISLYEALKAENPNAAPFTMCRAIEAMQGMKAQTAYTILRKYGKL